MVMDFQVFITLCPLELKPAFFLSTYYVPEKQFHSHCICLSSFRLRPFMQTAYGW